MIPTDILKKYYPKDGDLYPILLNHSFSVADKALSIAQIHPEMNLDITFVYEAAMMHDIGISQTNAPEIHCFGEYPYICHGYLGRDILEKEGLSRHALVCERHTGTGLSLQTIIDDQLPLPLRDMRPISLEEQLICFADKFFSKTHPGTEKSIKKIRKNMEKYGVESISRFDNWCRMFLG